LKKQGNNTKNMNQEKVKPKSMTEQQTTIDYKLEAKF
jgi:hypothetical protein